METHSDGNIFTPAFSILDFGDHGSFENQLQVILVNLCKIINIKREGIAILFILEYDPFDIKKCGKFPKLDHF